MGLFTKNSSPACFFLINAPVAAVIFYFRIINAYFSNFHALIFIMHNCPLCQSAASFDFTARYVTVYRCEKRSCHHLFAVDVAPDAGVHNYEEEMKVDFTLYHERNEALINYWRKTGFLKPDYKLLDFGSGTGHLLRSLKNRFASLDITGIEFNQKYHSNLKQIGVNVADQIESIEEQFDVITFIEVIEHLEDPLYILRQLKKRLKPGGKLFVTTPAGDCRKPLADKNILTAYESPFHVQFFTENSLEKSLKGTGFRNIKYKYIDAFYPGRERRGLKHMLRVLKMNYSWFKGYTTHLTYVAS
jgi:SAM-dependent methyltransferase